FRLLGSARGQPSDDEAGQQRPADGERQRVLLCLRGHLLRAGAGSVGACLLGLRDELVCLLLRGPLDRRQPLLGLALDVRLARKRLHGRAHLLARLFNVAPDLLGRPCLLLLGGRLLLLGHVYSLPAWARCLVTSTSCLRLSTACSGTGGVASSTCPLPVSASSPAIARYPTPTIRA